ncbi:MAG: ATP-binding protein [Microscillaceae bacterium]|jgi:AAA15 family ATPase/GTPase|nr:ATP-binding protein [Microscillaceae bacterium]
MKLIVENFGPIKKGEIDLNKKFYAFVGYNNTGKTYMSQLLWGIFNINLFPLNKDFDALMDDDFFETNSFDLEKSPDIIQKFLDLYADFVVKEVVPICFNAELSAGYFSNLKIKILYNPKIDIKILSRKLNYNHSLQHINQSYFNIFKEDDSYIVNFSGELPNDEFGKKHKVKSFAQLLQDLFFQVTAFEPNFLPASRTFFPQFYKYIIELERERGSKISNEMRLLAQEYGEQEAFRIIQRKYATPYNKITDIIFTQLYSLSTQNIEDNLEYIDLLFELSEIIGGGIIAKTPENIGVKEFYFRLKDKSEIPMFLASSSVNQLTLLNLFLKYWASTNYNFLFIDEPEENLHPSNQIKLTNLLLKFATRNHNRVLITTHSPLIAENINNYLYLSLLRKQQPNDFEKIVAENRLNIDSEIDILPEEIGIYFFKDGKITDLADESTDWGINFRDFYRVQQEVSNIGKILTDYLHYQAQDEEDILDKQPAQ